MAVVSAAESHYSILEVSKETEGGILAYYQGFNRSNGKGKLHRIPQSIKLVTNKIDYVFRLREYILGERCSWQVLIPIFKGCEHDLVETIFDFHSGFFDFRSHPCHIDQIGPIDVQHEDYTDGYRRCNGSGNEKRVLYPFIFVLPEEI